jgi:acetyl esterase/lipase
MTLPPDAAARPDRAYGDEAVQRLLGEVAVQLVNGSPVEVRTAVDLPAGHLDPWVVELERERRASRARVSRKGVQVLYSPFLSFGGLQPGLSFSPVGVAYKHRDLAGPQSFRTMKLLMGLLYRKYRGSGHRSDPRMSPALAEGFAGLPATLIVTGEMDPLHQPAEHFAGDLAKAGVPVRSIRYRGCKHDTIGQVGHVPQAEAAAVETLTFIEDVAPAARQG